MRTNRSGGCELSGAPKKGAGAWLPAAVLVAASFSAGQPTAVLAQEAGQSRPGVLEEIVVTARKREENVQDVPISIAAFTGEQLDFLGVEDLSDIDRIAPNVQFDGTAAVSGSSVASTV